MTCIGEIDTGPTMVTKLHLSAITAKYIMLYFLWNTQLVLLWFVLFRIF